MNTVRGKIPAVTLYCLLLALPLTQLAMAQGGGSPTLSAEEIARRLVESNREREGRLRGFHGCRRYTLQYTGFPSSKSAAIVVAVEYDANSGKRFHIVSEEGSHLIVSRVFKKLLESEQEASHTAARRQVAVSPENYEFQLEGTGVLHGRPQYILRVMPRNDSKFLYRGRIWVDAVDFALSRISAEPARNPSFWISHTAIEHRYDKFGDYWLPAQNTTTSSVRLGGNALLTIDYYKYQFTADSHDCSTGTLP